MIRESQLINLPIVKEDFEVTGLYVDSIIFSKKSLKVIGLVIKDIKVSRKKTIVIPYKKIKKIDAERVFIGSDKDFIISNQIPEIEEALLKPMKIIGFSIQDHNGDLVGIIKDTLIEIKTGKIVGFVISEGMFDDIIRGYSILPLVNYLNFDKENIIIKEKELQSILPQGGGLKKLLGID